MRWFNTAGPCDPRDHYVVPPELRLPGARQLIEQRSYFVVHAPRQTGKTTTIKALAEALTAEGRHAALYLSCEAGQVARSDYGEAQRAILGEMQLRARALPAEWRPPGQWPAAAESQLLRTALQEWAEACPRPLVLFFDEIDALMDDSLISVLRQLRSGYGERPDSFPSSVVLCGLRDVRDYHAAAGGDAERLGTSSPFNIKVESLRMADFSEGELRGLYQQHTEETGQPFEPEALDRAWELSRGQPWLANALARQVTMKLEVPAPEPITAAHVEEAKERLILERQTHLDSLVARLYEPRVRAVIEPLLAGAHPERGSDYDDGLAYVRDLGLIAPDPPVRVANPIYREVILRVLGSYAEDMVVLPDRAPFVLPDGRLDLRRILAEFSSFWCEHGEVLSAGPSYHEVAAQLVLMAYLQRVVNSGGHIDREYGVGRGRIDLLVRWPYAATDGSRALQRVALELKVWAEGRPDPAPKGLEQLDAYLDRLGLDTGVLVVFDRRPDAPPIDERTGFRRVRSPAGRSVTLLRL